MGIEQTLQNPFESALHSFPKFQGLQLSDFWFPHLGSKDAEQLNRSPVADQQKQNAAVDALPEITFLKEARTPAERAQQIDKTAQKLADFISGAQESVHIAIYDFKLTGQARDKIVNALNERAAHLKPGSVQIAFFQPEERNALAAMDEPADDEPEGAQADRSLMAKLKEEFLSLLNPKITVQIAADPRAVDLQNGQQAPFSPRVETEGIRGAGQLMHDKYVIRDGKTSNAAVWTGSANFTDSAFGDQDNNILVLKSPELASCYEKNFSQLWKAGSISGTGKNETRTVNVGSSQVTVSFSPGDGRVIDSAIAREIDSAKKSVHIASMNISSEKILKSLSDAIDRGVPVDGIFDGPQMSGVEKAWKRAIEQSGSQTSARKLQMWHHVRPHLTEKHSVPWSPKPGSKHNFMHNKVVTVDENDVVTGSYNFSENATNNAENILIIKNPAVARQYSTYIRDLVTTYGKKK